jgi:hypothetical protein
MNRRWHYLKPNENCETLQECIFVDTETDDVAVDEVRTGHRLRFGWAAYTRRSSSGSWSKPDWKRFTHYEDFWLWAVSHCRQKVKVWLWCHNSSFDYPVLHAFSHLQDIGWELESAIIDAPPTIVKYRMDKRTLVLCDTLNIWRMSLKDLGKRIGLEKLTMPEQWGETENDDYYCRRDVEIILRSVTEWSDFLVANDMGGFAPTIAAQSMRSFRHRWMDTRILIDNSRVALDLARRCYHGGRCEAHFIGTRKEPVYYLDVNSMYPFVMSYAFMPVRLKGVSHWVQVAHLKSLLKEYCLCAHVTLDTKEPFAAVRMDGKLNFPVGKFEAYLTTPEIEYALNLGAITEVHLCATYDREIPFRRFALDLYQHKENAALNGRDVEARHWKLLLNSFYGKWGQSGHKWTQVGTCDPHEFSRLTDINAQTKKITHVRHFGGLVFHRCEEPESGQSHPAIAAHICAHARMVLWTIIKEIPPSEYFYCDTDGILVSAAGRDALSNRLDQTRLGGLKQVDVFEEVTIYGCKDLVLNGKQKTKGIRETAERLDNGAYRQIRWSSLTGLLRSDSLNMPLTRSIDKFLGRTYDKGVVGADGFVSPLHLGEGSRGEPV